MKSAYLRLLGVGLLSALIGACGSDEADDGDTSGPGDTTVDDTSDGSSDTGDDTTPDTTADTTPDGSGDTSEDTSGDGSGGDTTPDGSGDTVECRTNEDCGSRQDCIDNECVRICAADAECDDRNFCTSESCVDNHCTYSPITPEIADPIAGDCKKKACIEGALTDVANPSDLPAEDGVGCTEAICSSTFPFQRPRNELCDDGVAENGRETCDANLGCRAGSTVIPPECLDIEPGWEAREFCGDGQDNDQNGQVDEGCPCEFGQVQRCYTGPPVTRGVGGCLDGLQQCENRLAPRWGPCEDSIAPAEETCDAKDNDCDNCVDDILDCEPLLTCPVEDFARPLRDYVLDGTAIYPNLSGALAWRWTVRGPPNSATTGPEDPTAARTSVYFDVSGDYFVTLEVTDEKGRQGCSWVVRVQGSGLRVEMRWDTFGSVDMDLHVSRPGATTPWCNTTNDCHYANCRTTGTSLPWGYDPSPADACGATGSATCNNPRLDIDNIRGFDPENINVDNPNNGDTFRVMAHMFSGSARTNPVITIYCGGRIKSILGEAPDLVGLTRAGSGCQGETWRVADVTMSVDARGVTDCSVRVLSSATGGWDVRLNDTAF
jgi:hypothetical protein